jgi:hypothetical protein
LPSHSTVCPETGLPQVEQVGVCSESITGRGDIEGAFGDAGVVSLVPPLILVLVVVVVVVVVVVICFCAFTGLLTLCSDFVIGASKKKRNTEMKTKNKEKREYETI